MSKFPLVTSKTLLKLMSYKKKYKLSGINDFATQPLDNAGQMSVTNSHIGQQ